MHCDPIPLTQKLLSFNTINPDGNEEICLDYLAGILGDGGFTVYRAPLGEGRGSLVARLHPEAKTPSLCLAGHVDTVPLGAKPWSVSPFDGEIRDGMLYGRGAIDMKGGIASMIAAALSLAPQIGADQDLVIHCYGSEETGCEGSFDVVQDPRHIEGIAAAIVGEPTSNRILIGHKGALWLKGTAQGITAHCAMPHEGDNALIKAVHAVVNIENLEISREAPHMGFFTKVVSSFNSGFNINSVPDNATFTVDMRTVPGQDMDEIIALVSEAAGKDVGLEVVLNVPPFWSNPSDPWLARIWDIVQEKSATSDPFAIQTVQFFTDAAALRQALPDIPIVILGPGDPKQAHSTDESCSLAELQQSCDIYTGIIRDWYGLDPRATR